MYTMRWVRIATAAASASVSQATGSGIIRDRQRSARMRPRDARALHFAVAGVTGVARVGSARSTHR